MKKLFTVVMVITAVFFVPGITYAEFSHMVRVGLVNSHTNRDSISIHNTSIYVGYTVPEGFMPIDELESAGGFTARIENGRVTITGGGLVYTFYQESAAQIMATDSEFVALGGDIFRGIIELVPNGGRVSAINVLSLEEYIFSVLTGEMSPSFHIEALKAQAVAARTFAFNHIRQGKHTAQNFDLCDQVHCQVYRGAETEHENTNRAVYETYELLLLYDGEPISANYFSSSGGATENSEDVWNEALPYLRSVNEIVEHNPMVWERTFTWAQLTTAANSAGAGIGTVNGISVSRLAASGRVLELTLYGTNGQWVVPRSVGVRGFFSPIGGSLPSRNFTISGAGHTTPHVSVTNGVENVQAPLNAFQALDSNGAVSTVHFGYVLSGDETLRIDSAPNIARGGSGITISGSGWGHGVGMSQLGAEGMARAGYTYDQILHHYYTGIEINWYD